MMRKRALDSGKCVYEQVMWMYPYSDTRQNYPLKTVANFIPTKIFDECDNPQANAAQAKERREELKKEKVMRGFNQVYPKMP